MNNYNPDSCAQQGTACESVSKCKLSSSFGPDLSSSMCNSQHSDSSCSAITGCSWNPYFGGYCRFAVNTDKYEYAPCYMYSVNETSCSAHPECQWSSSMGDDPNMAVGSTGMCIRKECWELSSDPSVCNSQLSCSYNSNSSQCVDVRCYENNNRDSCTSNSNCDWSGYYPKCEVNCGQLTSASSCIGSGGIGSGVCEVSIGAFYFHLCNVF